MWSAMLVAKASVSGWLRVRVRVRARARVRVRVVSGWLG